MKRKKKEIVIEFDENTIWTSEDKTLFRKTKDWIDFRNKIVKEREICEFCGYERRLSAHHIYLTDKAIDYTNLVPERFKVVCSGCHKFLHRVWSSYKRKKNPIHPEKRFEEILNDFIKDS